MTNTEKDIIDTRICRIVKIEEGFASFHFKGNDDSEVHEFEKLISDCMDLMDHKPFVVITDLRNNDGSFTQQVKDYLANHKELQLNKVAEALVVNGLGVRLQVVFFIRMKKTGSMLTKVFSDYDQAVTWIKNKKKELIDS